MYTGYPPAEGGRTVLDNIHNAIGYRKEKKTRRIERIRNEGLNVLGGQRAIETFCTGILTVSRPRLLVRRRAVRPSKTNIQRPCFICLQ